MSPSGPLIPEARFIRPNGTEIFVVPTGALIDAKEINTTTHYYEPEHKGHLKCPHCDADVRFRNGSTSVRGSSEKGRRDHFALFPGGFHDKGCDLENNPAYRRPLIVDRTKGFRIHINTSGYSDVFNEKSGVYDGGPLTDELRLREPVSIKSANDLVKLLERGEFERIQDSIVIFRNKQLSWNDFFIRTEEGNPRVAKLVDRLEAGEGETFCAIVVSAEKGRFFSFRQRELEFDRLPILRQDDMYETVIPQVRVRNDHNTLLNAAFSMAGSYLVLAVPTSKPYDAKDERRHYLTLRLDNRDMATLFDPHKTRDIGLERRAKRQSKDGANFSPTTP